MFHWKFQTLLYVFVSDCCVLDSQRVSKSLGHCSGHYVGPVRGVRGVVATSSPYPCVFSVRSVRRAVRAAGSQNSHEDEEVPQLHSVLHHPGSLPRHGEEPSREDVPAV